MAGSVNDKITDIRNAARPNSARATGTRSAGGTSLACDDLTGWPTSATSKVHFVTYQIDSNSNPVAGTQLDCRGLVTGNTIGSFLVLDGNDTGNAIGDVVEMLPTASWGQHLADALTNQHSRTGAHVGITNTGGMTTDTLTVSSGTTLPAGDIGTADIATSAVNFDKVAVGMPVQIVHTDFATATTGATVFPVDNTIPQITEGFEVMTQAITPKATGNTLLVEVNTLMGGNTGPRSFATGIWQDATVNALAATTEFQTTSAGDVNMKISVKVTATSTSSTTFRVRIGSDNGGTTVTFGNGRFGGIPHSSIKVTEIKV